MKILVIRTSAMGDVALAAPVIKSVTIQRSDIEIVFLTRPPYKSFFSSFPGVKVYSSDFSDQHSGLRGIIKVFRELKKEHKFDHVIDLHNVIRSKLLCLFFRLSGVPVTVIDKGRSEKKGVTSGLNKVRLIHTCERYYKAFETAGIHLKETEGPWLVPSPEGLKRAGQLLREKELLQIGIAPLAKHNLKMWPAENMIKLMQLIAGKRPVRFWLFGGKEETPLLVAMQEEVPEAVLVAGTLSLEEELALISRLDFMISMDSSNMHMAALSGTRVISLWGGTDPLTGFGAWKQPEEYSIRIPVGELTCRPCTVYGKGKCRRGDFACMIWLTPERVFERLINLNLF
ncbi:MAG: glycosyltransferase family 9 protein [Bacteroidales bacterium]|jgi:ADP-heptose:LPS heptosyltransferase|nr:glycosyltransferase family 9 protein [Bacteroidales bacterium]